MILGTCTSASNPKLSEDENYLNMSSEQQIFISYSREQLYFAESVATNLQSQGIEVWFDLQRLNPGSDWAQGIDDGLKRSSMLILVASPESLSSQYVTDEWQHAIVNNKPIHILVYEPVSLPDELSRLAVCTIDARGNFNKAMQKLYTCITTGDCVVEEVNTEGLLARRPLSVDLIILNFVSLLILFSVATVSIGQFFCFLIWLIPAGWIFSRVNRFLKHEFTFTTLRMQLIASILFAFIAALGLSYTNQFIIFASLSFYVITWFIAFAMTFTSADLLRWAKRGQAPDWLRRRVYRRLMNNNSARNSAAKESTTKTFEVLSAPEDARLAQLVAREMTKNGHKESDGLVDHQIVLLSNFVEVEWLQNILETSGSFIGVVCTPVSISNKVDQIYRYQLVDFRRQTQKLLSSLSTDIAIDDRPLEVGLHIVPQSLGNNTVPYSVAIFRIAWLIYLAYLLLLFVYSIFLRGIYGLEMPVSLVLFAMNAVALSWVIEEIHKRRVSIKYFYFALFYLLIILPFVQWFTGSLLIIQHIVLTIISLFTVYGIHRWLPPKILLSEDARTLAVYDSALPKWKQKAVITVMGLSTLFVLFNLINVIAS
jgi:hypothetical protein